MSIHFALFLYLRLISAGRLSLGSSSRRRTRQLRKSVRVASSAERRRKCCHGDRPEGVVCHLHLSCRIHIVVSTFLSLFSLRSLLSLARFLFCPSIVQRHLPTLPGISHDSFPSILFSRSLIHLLSSYFFFFLFPLCVLPVGSAERTTAVS